MHCKQFVPVSACLPACLLACLPACLPACLFPKICRSFACMGLTCCKSARGGGGAHWDGSYIKIRNSSGWGSCDGTCVDVWTNSSSYLGETGTSCLQGHVITEAFCENIPHIVVGRKSTSRYTVKISGVKKMKLTRCRQKWLVEFQLKFGIYFRPRAFNCKHALKRCHDVHT